MAKRLTEERELKSQPNFMYPIVSSLGYFNEDMKRLLNSIRAESADVMVCFQEY